MRAPCHTVAVQAARHVTSTVVLLVVFVLVGIAGLVFAELVPDRWVIDALEEAENTGSIDAEQRPFDNAGTQIDEFSECVALSVGLGETADQGLLETVALAPHLGPCTRLVDHLNPYDGARAAESRGTYLRYWHGSSPVVRPALVAFGVPGLRVVNALAVGLAGALLIGVVRHRAGTAAAIGLVAPYAMTTSLLSLPGATNQALGLSVGVSMAALVGTVAAGGLTLPRVWYPAVAAGAAFVYVDLLTVVPGVWGLTAAVVAMVAYGAGRRASEIAAWNLLAGVGWFVGYAGMWVGKWAFAVTVLGWQQVADDVSSSVRQRLDGSSPWAQPGFGNAIDANVEVFVGRPFVGTLLALTVVIGGVRVAQRAWADLLARLAVAVAGGVVFVWFEVASNHSQVHAWFTYRSLPAAMGIVLMAFLAGSPKKQQNQDRSDSGLVGTSSS